MDNIEKYESLNKAVYEWAKRQKNLMKAQVGSITLRDKHAIRKSIWAAQHDEKYKPLSTSIGSRPKKNYGTVNRINFPFSKQGLFLERGTGGYPSGKDSGGKPTYNKRSRTYPKPWIAPILDKAIDELADILSKEYADVAMGEIKFVIPGVIDRRIKIDNG